VIDLLEQDGRIRTVETAHIQLDQATLLRDLVGPSRSSTGAGPGVPRVLQSGRPELHRRLTEEVLAYWAGDAKQLPQLQALGLRSVLILPLRTRSRTLGTISFLATRSGRRF